MSDRLIIARAGLAELTPVPALRVRGRVPFLVLAFVGMALGLVGSCNTELNGIHIANAAMNVDVGEIPQNRLTRWQLKAYGEALASDPDRILKLNGREIAYTLGEPELRRQDIPSIVWQYRTNACVLDIYFVTNGNEALDSQARHYEVRDLEGKEAENNIDCVLTVVAAAARNRGDVQLASVR
ncbi:MAG: hypothetical protein EOM26_12215 [Alphaproteobacteria bacterium]|nr:hypothetical protein [Alphaproteobacteria bacterium]